MKTYPKTVSWPFEEGIRVKGMWEPIYFQKMRGGISDNQEQLYDFKRSRTYLEHAAEQGYTQIWFNWWKGYGLEFERERQDQVAELFPVCRDLGMRAVCYNSFGSLTFDTILHEEPDAVNWAAKTQAGQPTSCQVTYQCFRRRPCFSSDGYLSYMEKVLARAIDAGCDGIHFDNIGMQAEPEACHCERCTKLFREYLKETYGEEKGKEILGFGDFTHATVPWFNQHNNPNGLDNARVAHHRAWIDFKCRVFSDASNRLIDFIHNRNPEVFVEMNACEGEGFQSAFWRGNDYDQIYPGLEMVWDEGNGQYGVNSRGAMIGPQRAKKWAVSFGCAHSNSTNPIARALSFCEDPAMFSSPVGFWKKYGDYQLNSESCAPVAVLRERNSLTYNRWDPWEETLAFEQYLLERRIPFDFIHSDQLETITDEYRLIAAAGTEVISDSVQHGISAYVKQGGSVLFTGKAGVYDEYCRQRNRQVAEIQTMEDFEKAQQPLNAFHELIGPDPLGSGEETVSGSFGRGRAGWIREMDVDRVARIPANWQLRPDGRMMPRNAHLIDEVISCLVPEGFDLQVDTVGKLYVHYARRTDTGELLVHLINHEFDRRRATAHICLCCDREPAEIVSISVDDEDSGFEERNEDFAKDGNTVRITVSDIKVHRSVIIRF